MPATVLRLVLGSVLPDAVRLLCGLALGLLACLLIALHLIPALLVTGAAPDGPSRPIARPPPPPSDGLAAIFAEVEGGTGIPASLLTAIAFVESGFDPRAVGPFIERFAGTEDAHVLGLMQFLPSTRQRLAARRRPDRRPARRARALASPPCPVRRRAVLAGPRRARRLRRGLFAYNYDAGYVERVLTIAARYADAPGGNVFAARALAHARAQLGKPDIWGGADGRGFD